jgi:hypothetical protein
LFQCSVNSLCIFRDYAKSILSHSKNTPKLFNRLWKKRQNSLSAHGDYGYFRVVLYLRMLKVFKHIRRMRGKYFSANGEYAKIILHCSHNTPRGMILANFGPKPKKIRSSL